MKIVLAALIVLLAACPKKKTTPVNDDPIVVGTTPDAGVGDEPTSDVPRFEKQALGDSGISAYIPRGFPAPAVDSAEEGSGDVYTANLTLGGVEYGYIAVRLANQVYDTEDQVDLLEQYLDFLQGQAGVIAAVGYGYGHTSERSPGAQGMIDYWETGDGQHFEVIGWVTSTHILVLYLIGSDINTNFRELYFNGIVM